MQGYVYTRENNGTKEAVVVDKNSGKTIALSSFSGYMAFSGGIISEGMKATAKTGKGIAGATTFGKVFTLVDGVISGVFDKQGNPDKSMNDVVGTTATAILMGEAGAKIGAGIGSVIPGVGTTVGGAIGAVGGAITGSVTGAIWGEDVYEGGISAMSKAMDLADEIADSLSDYLNDVFVDDSLPPFHDNKATIPDDYFFPNIFPQLYDPITLDLNSDGKISTLNLSDGVYFDHNKDGVAFKTSWIGKDDGILVFDKDSNGLIDNGSELFGNFTEISSNNSEISNSQISNNPNHNISLNQNNPNNQTSNLDNSNSQTSNLNSQTKFAINGYHALSLQDTNNDGKIDALDENFSKLKIWQDLNENGISESNELKTLKEHGIKSISLNFTKPTNSDILTDSSDNVNLNDMILINNGNDYVKRHKFIQNLKKLTNSNQIVTKNIYNFKNYKLVA